MDLSGHSDFPEMHNLRVFSHIAVFLVVLSVAGQDGEQVELSLENLVLDL